jgi:hypothetical protein
MRNVGKKVANWVESQKEIAEEIGISTPSMNSMLTGKMKLPLNRFLQIIYYLNPPQDEVDEIFNIYLEDMGLPRDGVKIIHKEIGDAGKSEISISLDHRMQRLTDEIMNSDLDAGAKVKVYQLIQKVR